MPIAFTEKNRIFHLSTKHTSYLFRVFENDYLFTLYYGKKLRTADMTHHWQVYPSGFSPIDQTFTDHDFSQDLMMLEYPVYGHGDYRAPAVCVRFPNGSRLLDLQYEAYSIQKGKPPLDGLPCTDGAEETLYILLRDRKSGLGVRLSYSVFYEEDVIARSAEIINSTNDTVILTNAMSMSTDLPIGDFDMISLDGTHIRERQIERKPMRNGTQSVESRRGASSHHHNPFAVFAAPHTTEFAGDAYGVMLVYSGNFLLRAEKDAFSSVRVQAGINPFDFTWELAPNESFITPEALLSYSDKGLNRLSQQYHDLIRTHLGHTKTVGKRRPIVINNWEATYFNFDEQKLIDLIGSCKGLGIDVFVLDDGWFDHRDDDRTSLGDWFTDKRKLPNGLYPLIEACQSVGMQFGLWFEPEMISEDSELYHLHPDWVIGEPGRTFCRGRQQLILDLSREDVLSYICGAVGRILRENRISYVKWDMNRHMTDAYSRLLPPQKQPEIYHRYIKNLYRLLDTLTKEFPDVVFEGCSGGGGRFDAGMLYYTPQIWTSDNSDAIARLRIQYGTSLAYPPVCMTAHVSASPNHQLGRTTPFQTRGLVAMSASFGYELNPLNLTDDERAMIAEQTAQYKKIAPLVVSGDFYRLISPFEDDDCAWIFVSKDRSEAFAIYARQLLRPASNGRRIRFAGLDPEADYYIEELQRTFGGDELMYAGLSVPVLFDFHAVSYTMHRVN